METTLQQTDNKPVYYRISKATVMVPYRKPGNVVENIPVDFSVYQNGERFKAIVLCDDIVKRLTGLPNVIVFELNEGKPILNRVDLAEIADSLVHQLNLQSNAVLSGH